MNRPLRHTSLLALMMLTLASTSALAAKKEADTAAPAGGAVATVNGKAIPKAKADLLVNAQKAQGRPDSDDLRKAVKDRLIMLEVVAQEAQKKGLDKKPEVQAQADLARQDVLINAYLADYVRTHPVNPETVKQIYDSETAARGSKEYKARTHLGGKGRGSQGHHHPPEEG